MLWLLGVTFGNVLVAFLAPMQKILALSHFFWVFTALMAAAATLFTILASSYKGKTYLFYHNAALPGGDGFNRSVCVEELKFNPDGSIPLVQPTKEGPAPVATLDPYKRVEAETIAWSSGVKIEPSSAGGQNAMYGVISDITISTRGLCAHERSRRLSHPIAMPNRISPARMSTNRNRAAPSENAPVATAATAKR